MENIEYKNHILRSLSCPLGGIFSLETKNKKIKKKIKEFFVI